MGSEFRIQFGGGIWGLAQLRVNDARTGLVYLRSRLLHIRLIDLDQLHTLRDRFLEHFGLPAALTR